MTVRIACIVIDANDPPKVADFWRAVLEWRVLEESDEGISLAPPGSVWPTVDVIPVPDHKQAKNRLHLDLRADGTTFHEELARLEELGAERVDVGQGPDVTWVVFADPEGNEFCLLRGTVQEITQEITQEVTQEALEGDGS
ncbi:MAG TPA: VOC family protein [Acidimicrobiales bacterium]|nr:VOC family protein [Acidimicrobiales bacterium]